VSRLAFPFPLGVRPDWRRAATERHDVLVVGGGIHGAGVARDAALRGLRVVVIDRGDWAVGTSSRSSKLLHGGLRYLREGRFDMVREALRERELHRRLAPGHVRPLRFVVPPVPAGATPRWLVRAGIALYGVLAGRPGEARFWEGDPVYEDAAVDDARFCLEVVRDARRHGALAVSFVEWLEWIREGDRITGARVRDRLSGEEGEIRAEVQVNAAGPWAGLVRGRKAEGDSPLRFTRGTHVVLDRRADDDARLFFSPLDGRVLFLLPHGSHRSLLGTTDLDESGPTRDPVPLPGEISYLRDAFFRQFPEWTRWRPVGVQCGIRPLLAGQGAPSKLSREERIEVDPSGRLISILGGKYTAYRVVAERVVDRVERILGREPGHRPTRREPLPGPGPVGDASARIRCAFTEEDAVCLEDVFLRRTDLGLGGEVDPSLLNWAAKLWRLRWGTGEKQAEAEIEAFQAAQERRAAPLSAWSA